MSFLLLTVDTSGKNGRVALAQVTTGRSEADIVESVPLTGGAFSAQLIPQISALLAKHGYSKSDLSGFAVVSGPGSFTGLRVGLSAIQALAEILQKPIAAISLLEAVACSGKAKGHVLAVLDAGRAEVYVGDYEISGHESSPRSQLNSERLLCRDSFLGEAKGKPIVTPDAALAEVAQAAGIQTECVDYPNIALIARLGWERLERGQSVRPEDLEANYIRRSDAEIFSKPKP